MAEECVLGGIGDIPQQSLSPWKGLALCCFYWSHSRDSRSHRDFSPVLSGFQVSKPCLITSEKPLSWSKPVVGPGQSQAFSTSESPKERKHCNGKHFPPTQGAPWRSRKQAVGFLNSSQSREWVSGLHCNTVEHYKSGVNKWSLPYMGI